MFIASFLRKAHHRWPWPRRPRPSAAPCCPLELHVRVAGFLSKHFLHQASHSRSAGPAPCSFVAVVHADPSAPSTTDCRIFLNTVPITTCFKSFGALKAKVLCPAGLSSCSPVPSVVPTCHHPLYQFLALENFIFNIYLSHILTEILFTPYISVWSP